MNQQFYPNKIIVSVLQLNIRLLIILPAVFFSLLLNAQNFHLVKDINASTDANPSNIKRSNFWDYGLKSFAVLSGVSYFSANDGDKYLADLWRSDGTEAGTYIVKKGVYPLDIIASNSKLVFSGKGPIGLWTSDGTDAGTFPLLDSLPVGVSDLDPVSLTDVNGIVFFTIASSESQLWKTNGTKAGTVFVKNVSEGTNIDGYIRDFSAVKDKLYFTARITEYNHNNIEVRRLFVSDGTAEGTKLVSSLARDPFSITPGSANNLDSSVYFIGAKTIDGPRILYVSNSYLDSAETATGFTGIIILEYPQRKLINLNGTFYYIGKPDALTGNNSLYKYDKTDGSQPVKIFTGSNAAGSYSSISNLEEANGELFFSLFNALNSNYELWISDGTTQGTVFLKNNLSGSNFIAANGLSYFVSTSSELWQTDGTTNGTQLVKNINPNLRSTSLGTLTPLNNKLLFAATDDSHGKELWYTDATTGGTLMVKDINQVATAGSYPSGISPLNSKLLFFAFDGNDKPDPELFATDGTAQNTLKLTDSIIAKRFRGNFLPVNDHVYFWGNTASGKKGICKTDGTPTGTLLVKEITGANLSLPIMSSTTELAYFSFYNPATASSDLWRTDGTENNTYVLKNDFPRYLSGNDNFIPVGNKIFITDYNYNLWSTDGTVAGTVLVKALNSYSSGMAAHKDLLYFKLYSDQTGNLNLWKSDGTTNGTAKITDNIQYVSSLSSLFSADTALFFLGVGNTGIYGDVGLELYKTDGSPTGTKLVKNIHPGSTGTNNFVATNMSNKVFFLTEGSTATTVELWKTDGTQIGTQMISPVGNINFNFPSKIVQTNGKLYFFVNTTLWESDGTQSGTHILNDTTLADLRLDEYGYNLTSSGNQVFFTASNEKFGKELYSATISPTAETFVSAANGNWNTAATWVGNAVPPAGANVIVRHNVTGNTNAICNNLRVQAPGSLTVNTGVNIIVMH